MLLFLGLAHAVLGVGPAAAQVQPLPRAHAHNDYLHDRPLLDALAHGFGSVEVDVHLVDGELLVAHDREDVEAGQTLQSLYLKPLRQRIRRRDGSVYGEGRSLVLLIDIKSDGGATYQKLDAVLRRYADILTIFASGTREEGPVTAIISGNRPRERMTSDSVRFAAYDGRLADLVKAASTPAAFMPLISSHWNEVSRWSGEGDMPAADRERLRHIVQRAHRQGRKIRFWATPDRPALWEELLRAGVDYINADDLDGLQHFLLHR